MTEYRQALERGKQRIGEVLGAEGTQGKTLVTLANRLTLIRLLIVPLFWGLFFSGRFWLEFAATCLFSIGALTDLYDGKLARRRGEITPFGNFMDPLADKLLVLSAYWSILIRENLGAGEWMALVLVGLISLREAGLTVMRIQAITGKGAVVTSFWGKLKTTTQLVTLIFTMVVFNLRDFLARVGHPFALLNGELFHSVVIGLFFICTVTALVSGALYLQTRFHKTNTTD